MRRLLVMGTIAMIVALAGATGALASGLDDDGTTVVAPVQFTIPAGQCGALPSDLAIEGRGTIRTTTSSGVDDDVQELTIRSVAWGTATDNKGGRYVFFYANTFSGSSPGTATITDRFVLFGVGQARLFSAFKLTLSYGPGGFGENNPPEVVDFWSVGDPEHCDPI